MNATCTPGRKTRPTVSSMNQRRWFVRRNGREHRQGWRSKRRRIPRKLFDPSNTSPTTVSAVESMVSAVDEAETETETESDSDDDSDDGSIELGSQDTDDSDDEVDLIDGFLIVSSRHSK